MKNFGTLGPLCIHVKYKYFPVIVVIVVVIKEYQILHELNLDIQGHKAFFATVVSYNSQWAELGRKSAQQVL